VTCFPEGTLAWPEVLRPRLELRGDAVAEPPAIDIGADIRNIERRPAEPARITICRQSPQDGGYREIFVSIDGEQVAMLEYGDTYTAEVKPGPHRLRAHNTLFWKTYQVVLRPGRAREVHRDQSHGNDLVRPALYAWRVSALPHL
jgi:hypothetical protein